MKRTIYWCILFSVTVSLFSCKTHLYREVNKSQYYQIDSSIVADTGILNYYEPYKVQLEAEMNRVIGFSDQYLTHSRASQTLMGNFFTDALLWKGKQLDSGVVASFATKGGIRAELRSGDITIGDVFQVMPFENAVSILTLSGKDVIRWAEHMAETGGQPASGIKLVIKDDKVADFLIDGEPVKIDSTYKIVTYDYLANGGDYVTCFDQVVARQDYSQRIRETLIEYISTLTEQGRHIQAQLDGRVQIIE